MYRRFTALFSSGYWILPLLVFTTAFERLNIFIPSWDFSLKLSLVVLPLAALVLFLKKRLTFNPTFLFPFIALVLGVEVLSIFFSHNPFQSFQVVVFHLLMVGLFYLIVWAAGTKSRWDSLIWAWGIAAAVVSLLGIWQFGRYLFAWDPTLFFEHWFSAKTLPVDNFLQSFYGILSWGTRWAWGIPEVILRPPSTFIDVSTGASFVGIFLILGLSRFLSFQKDDLRRVLMSGLLIFSLFYFGLTISRSATFGLVAGLATFSYLVLRDRMKAWITPLILILAGLAVVAGVLFTTGSRERLSSAIRRLDYAQAAVAMAKHNPLLGVGAGNFENYYREVIKPGASAGYPHSILLAWLGELGILGLLANLSLAAVLIASLYRLFDRLKRENPRRLMLAGVLSAYIALLAANVFHAHYGLEFTWVLLGLAVGWYYQAKSDKFQVTSDKLDVLGVKIDNVTMGEAVGRVKELFKGGERSYVVTPNPEMVIAAGKDKEFTRILNNADLAVPDGSGLVWASRIWGTPLKTQVHGVDLFWELVAETARRGGRIFLLGANPGVAETVARNLKKSYPKLKVAGTFAGDGTAAGDKETANAIGKAAKGRDIDLLFVAYGHGKQERWISRNLAKIPVKVAVGVGGTFDYVSGKFPRPPQLIRTLGLEWLYRLVRQPRRIKRQLALLPFIFLAFREAFNK